MRLLLLRRKSALFWVYIFSVYSTFRFSVADNMTAVKGESFSMFCHDEIDDPAIYIELFFIPHESSSSELVGKYKPSTQAVQVRSSRYKERLSFVQQNFTIRNIDVQDEGQYKCIARAFKVPGNRIKSNNLEVYVRPTVVVKPISSFLLAGSGLVRAASCSASGGKPEAKIFWFTERYLLFSETFSTTDGKDAATTDSVSVLSVSPTQYYNKQSFFCRVEHAAFTDGFNVNVVKLNVRYSPNIPVIDVINDSTQLKCTADGNPEPMIKWIMPNNYKSPPASLGTSTIMINFDGDVMRQNDTYICEANNGIAPTTTNSITNAEAVWHATVVKTTNAGAIVGIVVGFVLFFTIIGVIVYWFFIRKHREKDSGPYNPGKMLRSSSESEGGWGHSVGRPVTQRVGESIDKNASRGPTRSPPQDDAKYSWSDEEEFTEGHDVDLNIPAPELDDDDVPLTRIVNKNSVNFQPRSLSQTSSGTARMPDPRHEIPPREYYEDDHDRDDRLMEDHSIHPEDENLYDRPEDRYSGYHPKYTKSPQDPESTLQYASIDHSYNAGKPRTRPHFEEPVEYTEIRSKSDIV